MLKSPISLSEEVDEEALYNGERTEGIRENSIVFWTKYHGLIVSIAHATPVSGTSKLLVPSSQRPTAPSPNSTHGADPR